MMAYINLITLTLQCVVLIGMPKLDAINTVVAAPNSTENPLKKK